MHKIEGLVKFNATLTKELVNLLQEEANEKHNGRVSELLRDMLTKRYKRKKLLQ